MEATGNYSALLVYLLSEAGVTTSLENPLKVKNFARAMLSTVKTDEIDARLIALYGEKMNPTPYKLRSDAILTLKQKFPKAVIRGHCEMPGATPKDCPCFKASKEFAYLV